MNVRMIISPVPLLSVPPLLQYPHVGVSRGSDLCLFLDCIYTYFFGYIIWPHGIKYYLYANTSQNYKFPFRTSFLNFRCICPTAYWTSQIGCLIAISIWTCSMLYFWSSPQTSTHSLYPLNWWHLWTSRGSGQNLWVIFDSSPLSNLRATY